jgi:hypothetical protein
MGALETWDHAEDQLKKAWSSAWSQVSNAPIYFSGRVDSFNLKVKPNSP